MNAISDVVYERLDLDSSSRTDPRRLALILAFTLVDWGGILWLGGMVWAKRSLASLGWRAPRPFRLVLLGLLTTAILFGGVFGLVATLGGSEAVSDFCGAIASMPA